MAKKKNLQPAEKPIAEDYYQLKTDAVEKLVNAKDAPEVSDEEIRKYTSKGKFHIPTWLKIAFAKFWFSGAVCYFFFWGLGTRVRDFLDLFAITAMAMGVITDLLLNNILRSLETEEKGSNKWMFVTLRKHWSIFLNILYAGVIMFCVYQSYFGINTALVGAPGTTDKIAVGVEPILFGILYMGFDMFFIMLKNVFVKIFRDAEKKVTGKK